MSGPGWWFGGPLGLVMMLLFWVLVIVAVGFLTRALLHRTGGGMPAGRDTPLEILERRYAAGDISGEEFKRIRSELT
ncbi:MAG: hypothetical protein F9K18_01060 [Thermoanaerobaculia bacterium]|nr:MAG: hypothetical protein F9K18_01060 [Thermoanaerobaculia bacterium]